MGLYLDLKLLIDALFERLFFYSNFVTLQIQHGLYVCLLSLVQDLLFFSWACMNCGTRV